MKAVIDCDPIVHIVANVQYTKGNRDNESAVRQHTNEFFHSVLENVRQHASEYIAVVQYTGHKNYRNVIYPGYKSHRKPNPATTLWKAIIIDELVQLGVVPLYYIESDDALNILAKAEVDEILIVENDKDLRCIPGPHYNPYKKNLEPRFYTVSEYEALRIYWKQAIMGDPTDMPGVDCGIERIGDKKADTAIDGYEANNGQTFGKLAIEMYLQKYGFKEGLMRLTRTLHMTNLLDSYTDLLHLTYVGMPEDDKKLISNASIEAEELLGIEYMSAKSTNDDLFSSDSLFSVG